MFSITMSCTYIDGTTENFNKECIDVSEFNALLCRLLSMPHKSIVEIKVKGGDNNA